MKYRKESQDREKAADRLARARISRDRARERKSIDDIRGGRSTTVKDATAAIREE